MGCTSARRRPDATYLYLVESEREGGRVRQRIIRALGRKDVLLASGELERLAASLVRHCDRAINGRVALELTGWTAPAERHRCFTMGSSKAPQEGAVRNAGYHAGSRSRQTVFQVHGVDAAGRTIVRRKLQRAQLAGFFAALPLCLVRYRSKCHSRLLGSPDRNLWAPVSLGWGPGPRIASGPAARHAALNRRDTCLHPTNSAGFETPPHYRLLPILGHKPKFISSVYPS
jgi:hypothetical protein